MIFFKAVEILSLKKTKLESGRKKEVEFFHKASDTIIKAKNKKNAYKKLAETKAFKTWVVDNFKKEIWVVIMRG